MAPLESEVASQVCPAAQGALVTGLQVLDTQLPLEGGVAGTWQAKTLSARPASVLPIE